MMLLTDAWLVLKAFKTKLRRLDELDRELEGLAVKYQKVLQWIPDHSNISGNDSAVKLANKEPTYLDSKPRCGDKYEYSSCKSKVEESSFTRASNHLPEDYYY